MVVTVVELPAVGTMTRRFIVLAIFSFGTSCAATAASQTDNPATDRGATNAAASEALAWLDGLDARYTAFHLPQTLARWQRAVGQQPLDTSVADEAELRFFADVALRQRLEQLSADEHAEVSTRARAWIAFLDHDRLENDPRALDLAEQMLAVIEGDGIAAPAEVLMGRLLSNPGAEASHAALDEIEARSAALLPLFEARTKALDEVARTLGASDVAAYVAGPNALETLQATCREQVARTADDWNALLGSLTHRLGHVPEFVEIAPATVAWVTEAGAFLEAEDLPQLAEQALAKMGFDLATMNIVFELESDAVGGAAFGISIPDDVRVVGNFGRPGLENAREYFRAVGDAVHMKMIRQPHLPARQRPLAPALREAVGELFASIPSDEDWVRATFPALTPKQRHAFHQSVRGSDALQIRLNCLQARLEQELYAGRRTRLDERWRVIFAETFGMRPPVGPSWLLFAPASILTPFAMRGRVFEREVRAAFIQRLRGQPLLSPEAGRLLTDTILVHGNAITLDEALVNLRSGG